MDFGGNMGDIMAQAQQMQRAMKTVQEGLAKRVVVGESGGGLVKAYISGQQEVRKVEIDKEVVDPEDVSMLEDLLLVALQDGIQKSKELSEKEMGNVTGGMGLPPGLF